MKKIIAVLITICFLAGCGCSEPNNFNDEHFCHQCHSYSGTPDAKYDCTYSHNSDCIKCHALDICKTGNDWKERELSKPKKQSKPSKKKTRKRR